jgi:dTDP-4-dehydrorhamnose 3,5-epimerase
MKIIPTPINGLVIASQDSTQDERGSFARFFCRNELSELMGDKQILQINHSITTKVGAIRGLHYQLQPRAEMKFVRCLFGAVWDVAVDLRTDSPTRYKWHAQTLKAQDGLMMVIPEGFAHGFQALENNSSLLYLHTEYFSKSDEAGLMFNDPMLSINWPLAVTDLSLRDRSHPFIHEQNNGMFGT